MQAKIKIYENRFYFYQWDKRQKLILNCAQSGSEVQFSNEEGMTKTEKAYSSNGLVFVNVPDEILQSSGYINVYVYVTDKAGSYTKHVTRIEVKSRPKPSSYDDTNTVAILDSAVLGVVCLG